MKKLIGLLIIILLSCFMSNVVIYAATIANDTFTDVDRTNLENHIADDGSTWTVDVAGLAQVDGNQLEGKTLNEGRNSEDMLYDNVSAQADCQVTATGSDKAAGVMVRMHNTLIPGDDGFQGKIEGSTNSARLVITKMVGGTETVLASTAADSYALDTWYTLKLTAVNEDSNTRLKLYVGTTEVLSFLETTDQMQGAPYRRAGVVVWGAKAFVDNWQSDFIPDITNTPSSWDFGVVEPSFSYDTGIGYPSSGFQLTNNSAWAVNITISATAMGSWPLNDSGSPTTTDYALMAGTQYTAPNYSITVTSGGVFLRENVAAGSTLDWGLQLWTPAPPSFLDGGQKSGTVTLTATAA